MRERQNSRDSIGGSCSGKAMTLKQGSVTTLQFQDDNTLISASDIDGIIKVRNKMYIDSYSFNLKNKCMYIKP